MLFCVIWIIVNEYIDFDEKSLFIVWAVVWTTLVIIPVSMFFLRVVQCFLDDPEVSLITKVVIGLVIIFSFGALLAFVLLYFIFYYWTEIRPKISKKYMERGESSALMLRFFLGPLGLLMLVSVLIEDGGDGYSAIIFTGAVFMLWFSLFRMYPAYLKEKVWG
ncbi:MAG TPA: hypothetical protein DCG27_08510 [Alcanivorax sp.]|nr:hypothetical protein [Alcanivorax sp.]HAD64073.1 hypothetical protein [Alcanivorax sp.]